jgi:hypothetical protein
MMERRAAAPLQRRSRQPAVSSDRQVLAADANADERQLDPD